MASLFNLDNPGLAYFSIPAYYVLVCVPHAQSAALAGKNHDNATPRATLEKAAKDPSISKEMLAKITRARHAHANGNEFLALWVAAVLAAQQAGLPARTVNLHCAAALALRAAYNYAYVSLGANRRLASVRSLCWLGGLVAGFSLLVRAGNALGKGF